jgi:hypothetical protein
MLGATNLVGRDEAVTKVGLRIDLNEMGHSVVERIPSINVNQIGPGFKIGNCMSSTTYQKLPVPLDSLLGIRKWLM